MCQLGGHKALRSVYITFLSSSKHISYISLHLWIHHPFCISCSVYMVPWDLAPWTHVTKKKQHPESKWSVFTLDGNEKSNNAAQKMTEYIFTKLANANNSSNAQMLRNVHKCKRVCLVCYDTLMMLLFLSVGPWRCRRKNSLKMKRGGANKERVTRGGRDSTITRWMERCRVKKRE